jgi:hypothetical protein
LSMMADHIIRCNPLAGHLLECPLDCTRFGKEPS